MNSEDTPMPPENVLAQLLAQQNSSLERLTRPYVIIDIKSRHSVNALYFRIRNAGYVPAYEIRMKIDPPITILERRSNEINAFTQELPVLAGQDEILFFLDTAPNLFNKEDASLHFTVHLTYRDVEKREYSDQINVNMEYLKGLAVEIPVEDRIVKLLEGMKRDIERIGQYTEELRTRDLLERYHQSSQESDQTDKE